MSGERARASQCHVKVKGANTPSCRSPSSPAATAWLASAEATAFQCVPPRGQRANGYWPCAAHTTAVVSTVWMPFCARIRVQAGTSPVRSAALAGQGMLRGRYSGYCATFEGVMT